MLSEPQTLLLDADDTLWENNIYFERAIAAFIAFLEGVERAPAEIREHLNVIERRTVAERGYGTGSFRVSLLRCFEEFSRQPPTEHQHRQIMSFVDRIVEAEIQLLPGVREAVAELGSRHRLILVTKGDDLEQREKLKRSGLAPHFAAVEVLTEKNPFAYSELVGRLGCVLGATWMVGNSPKSDVNPALEAGLNAVFVPHPETWVLEHEQVMPCPEGQNLLEVSSLKELALRM